MGLGGHPKAAMDAHLKAAKGAGNQDVDAAAREVRSRGAMANTPGNEKPEQILVLGRLGWSLWRI